jgi:hypothetical protein
MSDADGDLKKKWRSAGYVTVSDPKDVYQYSEALEKVLFYARRIARLHKQPRSIENRDHSVVALGIWLNRLDDSIPDSE